MVMADLSTLDEIADKQLVMSPESSTIELHTHTHPVFIITVFDERSAERLLEGSFPETPLTPSTVLCRYSLLFPPRSVLRSW